MNLSHKEITTVIPGAVNENQVEQNTNVSKMDEILSLFPKLNLFMKNTLRQMHTTFGKQMKYKYLGILN